MRLKVSVLAFLLLAFAGSLSWGQSGKINSSSIAGGLKIRANAPSTGCEITPVTSFKQQPADPTVQALFDLQFDYSATDSTGSGSWAGVVYTGTGYWISKWNSDTLAELDMNGSLVSFFTIPGVTGIRSMTTNGTNIYAGINTASIQVINPITKTVSSTIAYPGSFNVRWITYDPTANSNAGGFWVGNFNTDIVQIDMNGNILTNITPATHGLTGMYGGVYENITTGGPYLWIHDQGTGNEDHIVRLQLPAGNQTPVMLDVSTVIASTGALAGGICVGNPVAATTYSLIGVAQGTPNRLFAVELNDYIPPAADARLDDAYPVAPFIATPINHAIPTGFKVNVTNTGATAFTTCPVNITLTDLALVTTAFTGTATVNNLAVAGSGSATTANFTPSIIADYGVLAISAGAGDVVASNDTVAYVYSITDTIFSRENGLATGSLGIGDGNGGTLGQFFTLTGSDNITSVTFFLTSPTVGNIIDGGLYSFNSVTGPGNLLAAFSSYTITAADTDGVAITLPLATGPYAATAGDYFVGINETTNNITLGTTIFNYRPGAGWVTFTSQPWATSESLGFPVTYVLRMNVEGWPVGQDETSFDGLTEVYPNPSNGTYNVRFSNGKNTNYSANVLDMQGKTIAEFSGNGSEFSMNLENQSAGIYFLQIQNGSKLSTYKLIKN